MLIRANFLFGHNIREKQKRGEESKNKNNTTQQVKEILLSVSEQL